MFNKDRFIEDCKQAVKEGQPAVREIVAAAVSNPAAVLAEMGEPRQAGVEALYRSPELTVINFTWAPYMSLMPHNHQMFAVIGIYGGREDNVFWKRNESSIEAAAAKSLAAADGSSDGRRDPPP